MQLNKSAGTLSCDKLLVSGNVFPFAGTLEVTAAGDALAAGDAFDLFDATPPAGSPFSGSFSTVALPALPAGLGWDASGLLVDGTIRVTQYLTVAAGADNKVYDGITTATAHLSSDDILAGDEVTLNYVAADFSDKNVGDGKTVTVTGISLSGPDAGKYKLQSTTATATANISKAPLDIYAVYDEKTYDGTVTSSATPSVSVPPVSGSSLGITATTQLKGSDSVDGLTQSFVEPDAKASNLALIEVTGCVVHDGNSGGNYDVRKHAHSGTVYQRPLTITAIDQSKIYGTVFSFDGDEFTSGAGELVSGESVDSCSLSSTGEGAGAVVAGSPYDIEIGYAESTGGTNLDNYAIQYEHGHLTVTKAPATVTLVEASLNVDYDGLAHHAAYTTDPATGVHVDVTHKQGTTPVTDPTEPGSYDITATINDPNYAGDPATGTLIISLPAGPQAADDTATVLEDSGANTIDVLANDSSAYTKTVTAVTQGSWGAVAITHAGADLSYTPRANCFGSDSFTYTMSDGHGGTSTATVNVTCIGVNDAPSFTKGPDQSVPKNSGGQTVPGWATGISAGPNETSQTVDFVIDSNGNPGLFSAGPAVSATGALTYTPASGVTGSATIVLHLHDNGGTANGGVNVSATQRFTITVTSTTPPPSVRNDNVTVYEDSGATVINVLANDTGRYRLTITSVTQGAHGSVRIVNSGTRLAYTPAADFFGSDSFTYTVSDGHGGTGTATVNVTIIPVNHAPSFTKGPDQIARKDSGRQTVAGWATNISAGPNETGQTLSFSVSNNNRSLFLVQPAISPDGALTYTPAINNIGTATVTVTLRDNGGTAHGGVDHSAARTFRISVCNRYDQSDTHLHYDRAWQPFINAAAWLGNYSQSSALGASVTIRFNGTRLDWVATVDSTMGSADVYVDGVKKAIIDLAHDPAPGPALYQQDVFSTGYLSSRTHTVTIIRSSGNAIGEFISIDAVDVVGALAQAP